MALLTTLGFAVVAIVLLAASAGAVLVETVWHAALLLGVALVSMAALYLFVAAELLAAVQILVYVGGVLVLLVFAVMLIEETHGSDIDG